MDLTQNQRTVLKEMLAHQADQGRATTMSRTHAGVPAWWTDNGHSISQTDLTNLNQLGLAGLTFEYSAVRHVWRVDTEAATAALQTPDPAPAQHLPRRGDAVERWLVGTLDKHPGTTAGDLLTLYRMCADAGVALDADLEG